MGLASAQIGIKKSRRPFYSVQKTLSPKICSLKRNILTTLVVDDMIQDLCACSPTFDCLA